VLGVPTLVAALGFAVAAMIAGSATLLATAASMGISGLLFGILIYWLGAKVVPSWIRVGTDGVLFRKVWKRYVPYTDLIDVRIEGGPAYFKVAFQLASRKRILVPAATREQAESIVNQVDEALAAFQSRRQAQLIEGLMPGDQDVHTWRESLGKLLDGAGYRAAAVDREQLLRVVEDPGQPERVRIAAAVALKPKAQPDEMKRVRVAAEASASPRVRVALNEALDDDISDEELMKLAVP
jgi:hypothetical protein